MDRSWRVTPLEFGVDRRAATAGIRNYRQRGDFDRLDVNHRTRDAGSIPMTKLTSKS
jgi:hypothetical protein